MGGNVVLKSTAVTVEQQLCHVSEAIQPPQLLGERNHGTTKGKSGATVDVVANPIQDSRKGPSSCLESRFPR